MSKLLLFLFVVMLQNMVSGQSAREVNIIMHEVKPGETIRLISRKYLVSPAQLYELNKFAIDGISQGMVLQIPVKNPPYQKPVQVVTDTTAESTIHRVVSVADASEVEAIMDSLEESASEVKDKTVPVASGSGQQHKVVPGETVSAISRKYGISVAQLQSHNRKLLENGLKAGQIILIPSSSSDDDFLDTEATPDQNPVDHQNVTHIVGANETLYSISKQYNVSVDEIKRQNEKLLAHGLQEGQVIKIKPNN